MDTDPPPKQLPEVITGVAAEAVIAEYQSLRSEILERCKFQLLIMGATVALAVAYFPLALAYTSGREVTVLLAAPLLFAATAWLYFEQDIFITQAASYLNQSLAPALRERVSADARDIVMQWEPERRRMLFDDPTTKTLVTLMFWMRLFAVLGAGIAALVVALGVAIEESPRDSLSWWDYPLAITDIAVIVGLAWLSRHVRQRYEGIDPNTEDDATSETPVDAT